MPTPEEQSAAFAMAVVNLAAVVEWINDNVNPMDVFDREKLEEWATQNGWTPPAD